MRRESALNSAIKLYLTPSLIRDLRAAPLPSDVEFLFSLLAREPAAELRAVQACARPIEFIRAAAEFYVAHVLFHQNSDAYRVLGTEPSCPRQQIRANFSLLLQWLHPDSGICDNQDFFDRVVGAWTCLKTPQDSIRYDPKAPAHSQRRRRMDRSGRFVHAPFYQTSISDRNFRVKRSRVGRVVGVVALLLCIAVATWALLDPFSLEGLFEQVREYV